MQPYVLQGANGGWAWTGAWRSVGSLEPNAWNEIQLAVPQSAATPLYHLGVEFTTNTGFTGTVHVDAVGW